MVTVDGFLAGGEVDAAEAADVVVRFPSPHFPAPPAFQIAVPAHWQAVPVPDAEMAVRAPVAVDGFHPNVVVRVRSVAALECHRHRRPPPLAAAQAADGVEVISEEVRADLDTPARWLLVRFRRPEGGSSSPDISSSTCRAAGGSPAS